MKKIGIITFHNSYNCGSMLQSYAMQKVLKNLSKLDVEIIDFSNEGQKELYGVWYKNSSLKNIIKNICILPIHKRIRNNNFMYEKFKNSFFNLSRKYKNISELSDDDYDFVVAGSDQIWNITIPDYDDAYFLPWVHKAKKIAYAPSFGSKNIMEYSSEPSKYAKYIGNFDALSIRENNGKKWIKDLTNLDVPVLFDPTLLLPACEYDKLVSDSLNINCEYIFFYSPSFNPKICKLVNKISKKFNLKVYTWSSKSYSTKIFSTHNFLLPQYENPSSYLYLIKNAKLVITTSFHGTIFSTIYRKNFFVIKNGSMFGKDDRVITLLTQLHMLERLIPMEYVEEFDYLSKIDYTEYSNIIEKGKKECFNYLKAIIGDPDEKRK